MHETTALGAALAAGYAIGVWKEFEELKYMNRANRTSFTPQISEAQSARMYKKWSKAVDMCRGWIDEDEMEQAEVAETEEGVQGRQEQEVQELDAQVDALRV